VVISQLEGNSANRGAVVGAIAAAPIIIFKERFNVLLHCCIVTLLGNQTSSGVKTMKQ